MTLENILIMSSVKEHIVAVLKLLKPHGFKPKAIKDNGMDGLDCLSKESFDLVICDQSLKYINGWLCIKEIKSSEKIANIPVLLVGREDLTASEDELKEYGVIKYLKLPVGQSQFDFTLNSTLNLFRTSGTVEAKYTEAKAALIEDEPKEAVELYEELSHLTKQSSRSTVGLAQAYVKNAEQDKANNIITATITNGSAPPATLILGLKIACERGAHDQAEQAAAQLLAQKPGPYYWQQAVTLLGRHQVWPLVKVFCEKSLAANYLLSDFWLYLAKFHYNKKDYHAALGFLNEMEQQFGATMDLFNLRGSVSRGLQDYQAALKNYEQALRLAPRSAQIYYNLAMCNLEMNDPVSAEHYLESAVMLHKGFKQAQDKLDELRKRAS